MIKARHVLSLLVFLTAPLLALDVTNTSPPTYIWQPSLDAGSIEYIDRTYTFSQIPAAYVGLLHLQTANADKNSSGSNWLTFDVDQEVTVFLAHDDQVITKPAWLSTWTNTGDQLTGHTSWTIYAKDFVAGQVVIGGNQGGNNSMYVVILSAQGAAPLTGMALICQADFNGDKIVNGLDTGTMVAQFGTAGPQADFNGDGVVNGLDVGPFVQSFGLACKDHATVSWTNPTLNANGTPINGDHSTTRIYGLIPNPSEVPAVQTSVVIENLPVDMDWLVYVTALDFANNESVPSEVVPFSTRPD